MNVAIKGFLIACAVIFTVGVYGGNDTSTDVKTSSYDDIVVTYVAPDAVVEEEVVEEVDTEEDVVDMPVDEPVQTKEYSDVLTKPVSATVVKERFDTVVEDEPIEATSVAEDVVEEVTEEVTVEVVEEVVEEEPAPVVAPVTFDYVINTDSCKFHKPGCSSAKNMKDYNKWVFNGTRDDVIGMGYVPCGRCKP